MASFAAARSPSPACNHPILVPSRIRRAARPADSPPRLHDIGRRAFRPCDIAHPPPPGFWERRRARQRRRRRGCATSAAGGHAGTLSPRHRQPRILRDRASLAVGVLLLQDGPAVISDRLRVTAEVALPARGPRDKQNSTAPYCASTFHARGWTAKTVILLFEVAHPFRIQPHL